MVYTNVSSPPARRNNSPPNETILGFWRRTPETAHGYQGAQQRGRKAPDGQTGDSQMRTMSFILAFAFVMAGTSMAGSAQSGLPGIGTFSYNGSPVTTAAPHTLVVAAR
jgi:hypothetical protein